MGLKYFIPGVLIILVIFYLIYLIKHPVQDQKLIRQIDSLKIENKASQERIISSEKKVDSLFKALEAIKSKIIVTKEYHEKIIHSYDTATTNELEQFFTDRYGKNP